MLYGHFLLRTFKITTRATFQHRINRQIRFPQLRLIDQHGQQMGVVDLHKALSMAEEAELDLVEISPNAQPPVVKIMDYGKFCYEQSKKANAAKKASKAAEIKEMQFRVRIDDADYQTKVRAISKFLEEGHKVKVRIRFSGREIAFKNQGMELLERVGNDIAQHGTVEQSAKLEGRILHLLLAPKKKNH